MTYVTEVEQQGPRLAGTWIDVVTSGMLPGEPFRIVLGGRELARGQADVRGRLSRRVLIPAQMPEGRHLLSVSGIGIRSASANFVQVVRPKQFAVELTKRLKAGSRPVVRIAGLAPGERVVVRTRGKRISPKGARANAHGVYTLRVPVGPASARKKRLRVTGSHGVRKATVVYQVTKRAASRR